VPDEIEGRATTGRFRFGTLIGVATDADRLLRADAARNVERILRATRDVFAEAGPDASLDEIARQAGVGIRTLYRHFPNKRILATTALEQSVTEQLTPAIERTPDDDDPLRGLTELVEAAMSLTARDRNTLTVARSAGALTADLRTPFFEALNLLLQRAQQAGLVREDLVADDLPKILGMLFNVVEASGTGRDAWRRYLGLILDGMSPTAATPLPPAATIPE
jgi:AcrR family transcriptional regulator